MDELGLMKRNEISGRHIQVRARLNMKATRSLVFVASLLGAVAVQTFHPGHKFVVGDSDVYGVGVQAHTSAGEIDLSSDTTRKVVKVYDNGDADIETKVANLTVVIGGQPYPTPEQPPNTTRVNKMGMAVSQASKSTALNFMQFGLYFGEQDLSVGQKNTFEHSDEKDPKNHYKASVKLLSRDGDKAKISVVVDSFTSHQDTPMHLEGTATVDAATNRLISFTGTAKNLPPMGGGVTVSSADFSMERKGTG